VSFSGTDTPLLDRTTTVRTTHRRTIPNRRRRLLTRGLAAAGAGAVIALTAANWAPAASAAPAEQLSAARLAHIRLTALHWAENQTGKWYCWGGAGPTCYDCSGLVMEAYQQAGISLPHSTYSMLASGILVQVSKADRRPGDLAFYGDGHVELVTRYGTFGALETGTQVGYHDTNQWWYPTMYFEVK
jgi:cell wall-associated NlpC family hydrolase